MTKADELWEKYKYFLDVDGGGDVVTEQSFLAALKEYGEAVRKRDAEICTNTWQSASNERPDYLQNQISHGCFVCAAAIEREPLI